MTGSPQAWEPPPGEELRPIPWEDREMEPSWWGRLVATVKLGFSAPMEAAERIPVTDGTWQPYLFVLLCSLPSLLLSIAGQIIGVTFQTALLGGLGTNRPNPFQELGLSSMGMGALVVLLILIFVVVVPIFIYLGMLLGGAINHLFLWMFGGTKEGVGLEQTIRCYGYAHGIYQLVAAVAAIPLVGCFFLILLLPFLVVWLVYYGLALAKMHRTDSWRGIAAVFAPMVVTCCCVGLALATAFSLAAKYAH